MDTTTMRKKVMCGDQGWFRAPGDGGSSQNSNTVHRHFDWLLEHGIGDEVDEGTKMLVGERPITSTIPIIP